MRNFIFIYNAKGGKLYEALDFIHKYTSPSTYKCSLCMLTYNWKMREKWKNFINNSNHKFIFLHSDDLRAYNLLEFKDKLPICIERVKDTHQVTISSKEMNQLKDQDELISLFIKKIKD